MNSGSMRAPTAASRRRSLNSPESSEPDPRPQLGVARLTPTQRNRALARRFRPPSRSSELAPSDSLGGRSAGEHSEARKCGSGAAVPAEAAELNRCIRSCPVEEVGERCSGGIDVGGQSEVRPVDVRVLPWWVPPRVEVQPKRWFVVSGVRIVGQKRDANERSAVGEGHSGAVNVALRWRSSSPLPVLQDDREFLDEHARGAATRARSRIAAATGCSVEMPIRAPTDRQR